MTGIKKVVLRIGLVALLALLGAATVQAQTFPAANVGHHCSWARYNSSNQLIGKGVSLVTFQNVTNPQFYIQDGTLFTVYSNATTLTKDYEIVMDVITGQLYYYQPTAASPVLTCLLYTSPSASTVEWNCFPDAAGVKVRQWCSQP